MKPTEPTRPGTRLLRARLALCAVLLMTGSALASSPPIGFQHLSVDQGLSQDAVLVFLQDSAGFLWIGTEDGLNRYDGLEIRQFTTQPERGNLASDYVERGPGRCQVLFPDAVAGDLWTLHMLYLLNRSSEVP